MTDLWRPQIAESPLNFVRYAFPWGRAGTPLEHYEGPRKWQAERLKRMGDHILENQLRIATGREPLVYRGAVASGRGPGKSALASWLTLWNMSCHVGSTTIVTANTEPQLKTKTWAELGRWHTLAINRHWFERSATLLRPAEWFGDLVKNQLNIDTGYYYASALLWSEENPDAFAGAHNPLGMVVVFDEASGIPAPIWTVTEGFFTEPDLHRYWFTMSNPRRNTGAFFEAFHKHRELWDTLNLDSRDVEGTDKTVLNGIIKQYGEDSDEARVEVKGQFPHTGDKQFIGRGVVKGAQERRLLPDEHAGLIMGVDPARFGDDKTVITFRRGRDARSIPAVALKGLDNMQVAYRIAELADKYKPDAIAIDAGNGTGIIDRLRDMKYKVHEVWFGAKADNPEWANKGTELWARMRDWLAEGCIPPGDKFLEDDLVNREYLFKGAGDSIMLEPKEKMKDRGFDSPDHADSLACTMAVRVARTDRRIGRQREPRIAHGVDDNIFS